MKFEFNREELYSSLLRLSSIVLPSSVWNESKYFTVGPSTKDLHVHITGCDGISLYREDIPTSLTGKKSDFFSILPIDTVKNWIKSVPKSCATIFIDIEGDKVVFSYNYDGQTKGSFEITSLSSMYYNVTFPTIKNEISYSLTKEILKEKIYSSVFIGKQEGNMYFNFSPTKLEFFTMDRIRLAYSKIPNSDFFISNGESVESLSIVLDANRIGKIISHIKGEGSVNLEISENKVQINVDNWLVCMAIINEEFPNLDEIYYILKKEGSIIWTFDKTELTNILKRLLVIKNTTLFRNTVHIKNDNTNIIFSSEEKSKKIEERIDLKDQEGNWDIYLDTEKLLHGVQAIKSSEIEIEYRGRKDILSIKPKGDENSFNILMPMNPGTFESEE